MIVKPKKQRTPEDQVWVNQIKNKVESLAFAICKFKSNRHVLLSRKPMDNVNHLTWHGYLCGMVAIDDSSCCKREEIVPALGVPCWTQSQCTHSPGAH